MLIRVVLSGSISDCADASHDGLDEGHIGGRLAARDQPLMQIGEGGVFGAAVRAGFEVGLALERFRIVEQSLNAGDEIVPAFCAVHGCSVWLMV